MANKWWMAGRFPGCKEFCSAVVNVKSSCCLLLDARPTSPVTLLDNTGHPAPDHQTQVTTTTNYTATTY